jgi:hypothetical protein
MQKLYFLPLILLAQLSANVSAQSVIGQNTVSVATTSNGDIVWTANVDGHNRHGYIESKHSKEICTSSTVVDAELITPTIVSLYGNSFTDLLFFTGNGKDIHTIAILNDEGKVVIADQYKNDHSIDVSALNNGTYLIEIVTGVNRETYTRKFVKE